MLKPYKYVEQERPETLMEIRASGSITMIELVQDAGSFPDPAMDYFHLQLCTSSDKASAELVYGGDQFTCPNLMPGQICISPPGTDCNYHLTARHQLLVFSMPSNLIRTVGVELNPHFQGDLSALHHGMYPAPKVMQLMRAMWCSSLESLDVPPPDHEAQALHLAETLVRMSMDAKAIKARRLHLSQPVLHRVLHYIDDHLMHPLSLPVLAQMASLSEYHFLRAFKAEMGLSPHQYIIDQRIQAAKRLLKKTRSDIAGVAHQCGFASHQHLAAAFKRAVGKTPSSYRTATCYF
jgi:AraC family transcriptional regulator